MPEDARRVLDLGRAAPMAQGQAPLLRAGACSRRRTMVIICGLSSSHGGLIINVNEKWDKEGCPLLFIFLYDVLKRKTAPSGMDSFRIGSEVFPIQKTRAPMTRTKVCSTSYRHQRIFTEHFLEFIDRSIHPTDLKQT